jgi:hypothetical protein
MDLSRGLGDVYKRQASVLQNSISKPYNLKQNCKPLELSL